MMQPRDMQDVALQQALVNNISGPTDDPIQVGLSDVPSATPAVPYLIVSQSPSPRETASMADPYDMRYFDYLIKSVGRDHRETTRVSAQVLEVMSNRRVDGSYIVDMDGGFQIVYRTLISEGIVVRSQGPELFEKNDVYRICVTKL